MLKDFIANGISLWAFHIDWYVVRLEAETGAASENYEYLDCTLKDLQSMAKSKFYCTEKMGSWLKYDIECKCRNTMIFIYIGYIRHGDLKHPPSSLSRKVLFAKRGEPNQ